MATGQDDDFLATMLGDFLDESQGYLSQLNESLLELDELARAAGGDSAPQVDAELLNGMFRAAHSLKGLSGMLRLGDINTLTHKIENVFDAARHNTLPVTTEVVELMFQAVDRLVVMIDQLNQPQPAPVDYQAVADAIHRLLERTGVERPNGASADVEQALQQISQAEADAPLPPPSVASPAPTASEQAPVPPPNKAIVDPFDGLNDESEVNGKYLSIFIDETESSLDGLAETLLSESAAHAVEDLLVTCHRIKGAAATIGLHRPARLAHAMEDMLQDLAERKVGLSPAAVDAALACVDALRSYIENLKTGRAAGDSFSAAYRVLREALPQAGAQIAGSVVTAPSPAALSPSLAQIAELAPAEAGGWVGVLEFQAGLPLAEIKAQMIYDRLSAVGDFFHCQPPAETLESAVGLTSLSFGLLSELGENDLRQKLSAGGVTCRQLTTLADLRRQTKAASPVPLAPAPASPALATIGQPASSASERSEARPASSEESQPAAEEAGRSKGKPAETLRVDIERLDQLMNLAGQLVINKARFGQIGEQLKSLATLRNSAQVLGSVFASLDKLHLAAESIHQATPSEAALAQGIQSHIRQIRVDLEPVQRELGHLSRARTLVNDLSEAVHQLDRVSDGIQKSVMDTRMVPIGPLFGRFKRVIRDITRANGKDIALVIRGENTELDKRMIDELSDPLIHLVRNAADHGVETPQAREAAGKPRQGTVTLDAFHRGNRIFIEVRDDGRGLDADRIRAKAVEKGLLTQADAERLSPHQAYQLIWEPGFSTAEKVTEVSGRGMGMDIVRSRIEAISGSVELTSEPGKGAVFTIKLPLTMAILPSLLTEIGGDVFAIPVESVVEIVSVGASQLTSVHGLTTATIRGRVVSMTHLEDLLRWRRRPAQRGTAVIVVAEGRELGVLVDGVIGEQDIVIKSLADNYRNVPGLAGASILGDGRVSLILDVGAVLEMACRPAGRRDATPGERKQTVETK